MIHIPLFRGSQEVFVSVDGPGLAGGSVCSCLKVFHTFVFNLGILTMQNVSNAGCVL